MSKEELYEQYTLSDSKADFIAKLIPDSHDALYFQALHTLNTKTDLNASDLEVLNKLRERFNTSKNDGYPLHNLDFQYLLSVFDSKASTAEQRSAALVNLKKYFKNAPFYHLPPNAPPIASASNLSVANTQEEELKSILDESTISLDKVLDLAYTGQHFIQQIQPQYLTRLDASKLLAETKENKDQHLILESYLSKIPCLHAIPEIPRIYQALYLNYKQRKQIYDFNQTGYDRLSIVQLNELGVLMKDVVFETQSFQIALIKKKFFAKLSLYYGKSNITLTQEQKIAKRELLITVLTWAKEHLPKKHEMLIRKLNQEIVVLDELLNNFKDTFYFTEFLNSPPASIPGLQSKKVKDMLTKDLLATASEWNDVFSFTALPNLRTFIENYLLVLLKDAESTKQFDDYLEESFLKKTFYRAKILSGQQEYISKVTSIFSKSELDTMIDSRSITILEKNSRFVRGNEDVILTVETKNIQNLVVNIFEIKTEDYYLQNKCALDNQINLDGLIPLHRSEYTYNEPSNQVVTRTFNFETIKSAQRGYFIVDFFGNSISSRAVFQKGLLTLVDTPTIAGHLLCIVDESQNICKPTEGKRTGIWIQSRFHTANEDGHIVIPYGNQPQYSQTIIVHEDYSALQDININREQYDFKCVYLYNQESFLQGSKAKVLIRPLLSLNGIRANLDVIEEQIVKVNLRNHLDIPTSLEFKDIKFDATKDIEIEIPIQSILRTIQIDCSGVITKLDGSKQNVHHSKNISIELHQNPDNQIYNLYLRKTEALGYAVYALDKTGQPLEKVPLKISLQSKSFLKKIEAKLQTDADGKVVLGQLRDIISIFASVSEYKELPSIKQQWSIDEEKQIELPSSINVVEGELIEIPLPKGTALKPKEVTFYSFSSGQGSSFVYEDLFGSLKQEGAFIQIQGLPVGQYTFLFLTQLSSITINVHNGKYWVHNNQYIMTNNTFIFAQKQNERLVTVKSASVVSAADSTEVLVNLNLPKSLSQSSRNKLKVHVIAHNFVSQTSQTNVGELQSARSNMNLPQVDLRLVPANFFNNKKIGDEICYVYNRQNEQRRIGNTLEKPCMLLKRTQNRETTFDKEKLEESKPYSQIHGASLERNCLYGAASASMARAMDYVHGVSHLKGEVDSFLNFLKHPCLVLPNHPVDSNGQVKITIDASEWNNYPTIEVIVSSDAVAITDSIAVSSEATLTQDLRHQSTMKSDQLYTENFSYGKLLSGQSLLASADSTTAVIGSIPELFEIQKVLMKTGRSTDTYLNQSYNTWAFLKDWNSFTDRQKLDKYNEFASHELNVFTYFKDERFFKAAVAPFLQNKIQKTFIDYFLVNDVENVMKYSRTERVGELNVFEQSLLVLSLVKNNQKARAEVIASAIENIQKTQPKNIELQKRLFLTIIESSAKDEIVAEASRSIAAPRAPKMMMMAAIGGAPPPSGAAMRKSMAAAPQMKMALRSRVAQEEQEECEEDIAEFEEKCSEQSFNVNESALLSLRKEVKQGYKKLEKTIEYIERQYYGNKETQQYSSLVQVNRFWSDLVRHIVSTGGVSNFVSENFIYGFSNHVEAIAVLSLLDISFSARDNYDLSSQPARKIQVLAKNNVVYFSKEILQSSQITKANVGIIQKFFNPKDRYTTMKDDPSIEIEKEVEEFVVNTIYGCKVIITNISIANLSLQVLAEIPEGSIPVNSFEYTKSIDFTVNSYQTYNNIEFYFYFPKVGEFSIYRSSASRNGVIVAQADPIPTIVVKAAPEIKKMENLSDILNNGSKKDIIDFAKASNLSDPNAFNITKILKILQSDKQFFLDFLEILRQKGIFNLEVWELSLGHNYEPGVLEILNNSTFRKSRMNSTYHNLPSLITDSLAFSNFAVFEYHPLLTSRVHSFMDQNKSKILNVQFKKTYFDYVTYLSHVAKPTGSELLVLAYYLILQERIDEALSVFKRISEPELATTSKIQYDYFSAYLDIYTGGPNFQRARLISDKYIDYPIVSWRNLFVNLSNQLAEYDGEVLDESEQVDTADLSKNLKNADKEPSLTMEIVGKDIIVVYQNTASAELNFYQLDVEVLFSTQPFPSGESRNNFSFIKPNESLKLNFEKSNNLEKLVVKVPENLARKNLHVQLVSEVGIQNLSYFQSSLKVQTIDKFGQVKVTDESNASLSKVYVKCFAKYNDDSVEFFRDGYTDLRGRFDYALSSSGDVSKVKSFAILVSSEEHGAVIREAKPPVEGGKIEATISLLKKK